MDKMSNSGDRPCARPGCTKRVPATGPKYHSNSCKSAASRERRRAEKAAQSSTGQRPGTIVNRSTSPSTIETQRLTELSDKFGTIAQELQALSTAQIAVVAEHRILRQILEHTIPQAVAGDRSQLAALVAGFDAIKHSQSLLHSERESLTRDLQQLHVEQSALRKEQSALLAERDELRAQREEQSKPWDSLHAECSSLRTEASLLVAERDALKAQREEQSKRWDSLHAEYSALRTEASLLVAERDALKAQQEEQSKRWDSLHAECSALQHDLTSLMRERNELRAKQEELRRSTPQDTESSLVCVAEQSKHPPEIDWEELAYEQREAYSSLFEDMRLQFLRLLPLIPKGAGPLASWSTTSIESHSYWKHWLVPLLGPQLEQSVKNTGITSPQEIIARVNRMLPYAVLAAQLYLSEIIIRPARAPSSDTKISQWIVASMRAAPMLYPPQFLSVAEQDPTMLSLATVNAMTAIHRQLLVLNQSLPPG